MDTNVLHFVTQPCCVCAERSMLEVNRESYYEWKSGNALIQEAFPAMSAGERELLITGTHSECWEKIFGGEE